VFTKLNANLHGGIKGAGCPAYVRHNCLNAAADRLSFDFDNIVVKFFSYFFVYTMRTESLKGILLNGQRLIWHYFGFFKDLLGIFDACNKSPLKTVWFSKGFLFKQEKLSKNFI